jgi:hypothetical protein
MLYEAFSTALGIEDPSQLEGRGKASNSEAFPVKKYAEASIFLS